ncbi:hypothetical protein RH831_11150 [Halodesulfurarchaeum sp. HSR-GB]|uniref:hypothetical protein n=1 Tax=Halodesulfurarchaeum sp. HSR-GB TaxID=3074077 RepID=UPI002854A67E|nr:hypothetical protein [Halodesulfurarchaeum sp. HSR-GB]MDR5657731.1 hypothetical protein [Halodesulfurarchaeum sp. HSR-GB]
MEGGAPDAVHGIQAADSRGWLSLTYDSPVFEQGLNNLVAWILSGGSIARNFEPHFAVGRAEDADLLSDFFSEISNEYQISDRPMKRADEAVPSENGAVLGRVLHILGVPTGEKAQQTLSLPSYLHQAPKPIIKKFAGVYINNRGTKGRSQNILKMREKRNDEYLDELIMLFRSVLNSKSITRSGKNIIFSNEAKSIVETQLPYTKSDL